jgi:hypothetical protein
MSRSLLAALLVIGLSSPAFAGTVIWPGDADAATNHLYHLGSPATAKDPPTAPLLYGGHLTLSLPCNATGGTSVLLDCPVDAPLAFGGGHLQLPFDSTLRLNGSQLGLATLPGLSILGTSSSSTGPPAAITASANNQVLQELGGALQFHSFDYSQLTGAPTSTNATWALAGARVFAVAPSGIDSNACYADSADRTQTNIAAATVTAGATPCATLAGAAALIPASLNGGRFAYVVVSGGTGSGQIYTDPWPVFDRPGGTVVVYATGTNSTCGATAFTGTTNDLICQGARTAAGMNAAGYNPTSSTTSQTIQLTKVGGGSPSFSAEPAKPLFVRARFDNATATSAQRNQVYTVVQVVGSDTIVIPSSIAFTTSDVLYLEDPGPSAPGGTFRGASSFMFAGIQATSNVAFGPAVTTAEFGFVQVTGNAILSGAGSLLTVQLIPVTPFPNVGPSLVSSTVNVGNGSIAFTDDSIGVIGTTFFTGLYSMSAGRYNYFGGNVTMNSIDCMQSTSTVNFGPLSGFASPTPPDALRAAGQITINGSRMVFGAINLPSTSAASGIVFKGSNDIVFAHSIYGGTKTNVGIDASGSVNSHYAGTFNTDSGTYVNVTGTNGDVYYGVGTGYVNSLSLYLPYAGITWVGGGLHLPSGDLWLNGTSVPVVGNDVLAIEVGNHGSGSIPVGNLVAFNRVDGRGAVNAFADNTTDVGGALGVSLGIGNGVAGYVVVAGNISVNRDSELPFEGGGYPAYVSAANAGHVTIHPPTSPNVVRQVGWLSGESEIILRPDSQPGIPSYTGGTAPTSIGYVKSTVNSTIQTVSATVPTTDLSGILQAAQAPAYSGAVTTSAGSLTTAFGTAPATTVLSNTTNATAVPTWLACTGTGQVIQDTGTAMSCAALAYSSLTGAPNFLLDPGGNGLVVRTSSGVSTARTLTSSGATITVTNGTGVSGNPNIDLPNVGPGAGLIGGSGISSVTLDPQGRLTAVGTATYLTTISGITAGGDLTGTYPNPTIAANAVTNAKAAQMAAGTIKGNNTGGTANALDLTETQVTAMLNQFTTSLQGLVPPPGSVTGKVLSDNGTWVATGGSGTVTSVTGSGGVTCSPSSPNPNCSLTNIPSYTVLGNNTVSSAAPVAIPFGLGTYIDGSGNLATNYVSVNGSDSTADYLANKVSALPPIYVAANAAYTPPMTGLKAWFKADVGVTGGSSPTAWADQSGNSNNLVVGSASLGFNSSSINGLPGITWNGTASQRMVNTSVNLVTSNAARTVIVVAKPAAAFGNAGSAFDFRLGSQDFSLLMGVAGGNYYYSDGALAPTISGPPSINGVATDMEWLYDGANFTVYINGALQTLSSSSGGSGDTGTTGFEVGNRLNTANQPFNGDVNEVLVYDHKLTCCGAGTEMNQVRYYIQQASRYNIALGASAPSATETVQVSEHGAIVSGSSSTTAQNLGILTTGLFKGTVSAGVSTISTGVAGIDYQAPGNYITALVGDATGTGPGSTTVKVVGMTDGASADWTTSGQTFVAGQVMTTIAGNHINTQSFSTIADTVTKHDYFISEVTNTFLQSGEWAATSDYQFPASHLGIGGLTALEYPNDFTAGHVAGALTIGINVGVGNNVTCNITRNGSAISGTTVTVVLGTTTGTVSFSSTSTGSSSASDTYGLYCVQLGGGAVGAAMTFSYQMVLTQ